MLLSYFSHGFKTILFSFLSIMVLTFMLVSCGQKNGNAGSSLTNDFRKESYVNGIIYQLSAEVKALQMQAFRLAKIRLDERLVENAQGKYSKPIAIISDIDATLADDAMYMADIVQREAKWDNGPWDHYYDALATTATKAIPGSLEFIKYAKSKGVEVFYITNRDWNQDDLTVKQLAYLGFPNADLEHVQVMNKEGSSNKTKRRENVLKNYDVVLYIGDNIGDFTDEFTRELGPFKRTQMAEDDNFKNLWGDKWIVLPNATYGDYVGAVWHNDKKSDAKKRNEYIKTLFDEHKFSNTEKYKVWYEKKETLKEK